MASFKPDSFPPTPAHSTCEKSPILFCACNATALKSRKNALKRPVSLPDDLLQKVLFVSRRRRGGFFPAKNADSKKSPMNSRRTKKGVEKEAKPVSEDNKNGEKSLERRKNRHPNWGAFHLIHPLFLWENHFFFDFFDFFLDFCGLPVYCKSNRIRRTRVKSAFLIFF